MEDGEVFYCTKVQLKLLGKGRRLKKNNNSLCVIKLKSALKIKSLVYQTSRGTPALHLNEAADGSCCDVGLGLVWRCYWIYMSFVCLIQKKIFVLDF